MGLLDTIRNEQPTTLGGTDKYFIDADTLAGPNGERYRIQGVDAAEVSKLVDGKVKQGTAGGYESTGIIHGLANEQGFTNITPLYNPDGTPMVDDFGRQIIDLKNESGESFRDRLLQAGAFDVNKYTTDASRIGADIAEARRNTELAGGTFEADAFELAAEQINNAEMAEGAKSLGFKKTALNEAERQAYVNAGLGHMLTDTVQVSHSDRNINNESLNPWSDSWEQGWIGLGEAAYGMASLLGHVTEEEGLEAWGEAGVERQRAKLAEYGTTILDYKEVANKKGWGKVSAAFDYLGNNLALSIPYMAATIGATIAAPVTGGLSYSVPVAMYTGQTWNEMEGEKDARYALAGGIMQAALDRVGLSGIAGKTVGKEAFEKGVQGLMKRDNITREVAENMMAKATRREMAEFSGAAMQFAKEQIAAKNLFKKNVANLTKAAGSEGITEAMQEATAYTAATQGSDKEFNWHELNNRMISAAIAGSSLGGAMAMPAAGFDAGAWADIAYRLEPASQAKAAATERYQQEEQMKHGRTMTTRELVADAGYRSKSKPGALIGERADAAREKRKQRTFTETVVDNIKNPGQLWQGTVRNIFNNDMRAKYRSARVLHDVLGGGLDKVFSGAGFENAKHHNVSILRNLSVEPEDAYMGLTGKRNLSQAEKKMAGDLIYSVVNKDGSIDLDKIADPDKRAVVAQIVSQNGQMANYAYNLQKKYNDKLGYIDNYAMRYKALDKQAIAKNRNAFEALLAKKGGMSSSDAKDLVDEILRNQEVNDVDEAFSVTKGGISPQSHKKRSLNMADDVDFKEFMERDFFANQSALAKSAARFAAHREFIGENGAVVSKLLDDLQEEGMPEEEVNEVAARVQDYLDAESGNYNRPTSAAGKKFEKFQRNIMFLTTMSGLSLATVSSLVETMLISRGLTKDQIMGEKGSIAAIAKEAAVSLSKAMDDIVSETPIKNRTAGRITTEGRSVAKELGYYDWDVGAATTTGVTETNPLFRNAYENFFKATGLQGYTNFTRAARASLAADYIFDKITTLQNWRNSGEAKTREIQEVEDSLRNLGVDMDAFPLIVEKQKAGLPLDPREQQIWDENMREGSFNFVNDAIALPQSSNRPLIYQDPRFALFTQFQGFIATFTANHIPKLWNEYVKRGTPAMKYNAFALATTMIAMGFVSQYLKDLIKYGGHSPYIEGAEYFQRGVRASGLLGSSERVLDWFFPIYEQRTNGVADWAFSSTTGESPALGWLLKVGSGAGKALEGDAYGAVYTGLRAAPFTGPLTDFDKGLAGLLTAGDWNYRGGQ